LLLLLPLAATAVVYSLSVLSNGRTLRQQRVVSRLLLRIKLGDSFRASV
jgi:hypothetical protein